MPWICVLSMHSINVMACSDFPFAQGRLPWHTLPKSILLFSLNSKWKPFQNSHSTLAAVYTDMLHFSSWKFTQMAIQCLHKWWYKVYTSLQQGNTLLWSYIFQMNGSELAKSGSLWSCLAGSRSKQGLFCTKSSVHGILVMKTRCSLTTGRVNNSSYSIMLLP